MEEIDEFLRSLVREHVSDIHFKVRRPPLLRVDGQLLTSQAEPLTVETAEALARRILGEDNWNTFMAHKECDTSYSIPGLCRFRVNAFRQRGTISMVLRIIPFTVPSLDQLNTPPVVRAIATFKRGLVLCTGTVGMGKSSTLAAMIRHLNETRRCHIITLEDPIEFLHRDSLASVNQREISVDADNFSAALKSVLRQDPDAILVGEMRDRETMRTALSAAESGHLVFSTMHTADAKETIGRFVDMFPPDQEHQIRLQLSSNLAAVMSQRLLPRRSGKGRALAMEILVVNRAIRDYILDPARTGEIAENMAKGRAQYGSQTFDQALLDLYRNGEIAAEVALANATSPNDLRVQMRMESRAAGPQGPSQPISA